MTTDDRSGFCETPEARYAGADLHVQDGRAEFRGYLEQIVRNARSTGPHGHVEVTRRQEVPKRLPKGRDDAHGFLGRLTLRQRVRQHSQSCSFHVVHGFTSFRKKAISLLNRNRRDFVLHQPNAVGISAGGVHEADISLRRNVLGVETVGLVKGLKRRFIVGNIR